MHPTSIGNLHVSNMDKACDLNFKHPCLLDQYLGWIIEHCLDMPKFLI